MGFVILEPMLPNDLNARLMVATEGVRQRSKLESMLQTAEQTHQEAPATCARLAKQMAGEAADVELLEGLSITGLFYSFLGTKLNHLESEKRAYLAAKLKHDESVQVVEDSRRSVRRIQAKLDPLAAAQREYKQLLSEKELYLLKADSPQAAELSSLCQPTGRTRSGPP